MNFNLTYMKGLIEIRLIPCLLLALTSLLSAACVNEEYDLEKEIDMNVTVLRDIALPLGSFEKVTLDKLLDFTGETEMLEIDDDGNMAITFADASSKLKQTIMVPDFEFYDSFESVRAQVNIGDFNISDEQSSRGLSDNNMDVTQPREFLSPLKLEISFIDDNFPKQIKDIGYAEVDAHASMSLAAICDDNDGLDLKVVLAAGTAIEFPEWVVFGEFPSIFTNEGNVFTLKQDIPLQMGTYVSEYPHTLDFHVAGLDASKLPQGQGIRPDGTLMMEDYITIHGLAYLDVSELGTVNPVMISPVISAYFEFSDIDIDSIEVLFGDDIDIDLISGLSPVTFNALPDFLSSKNVVLDLADIRLDIDFENASPFAGTLSAVIESSTDDKLIAQKAFGPVSFDAAAGGVPAQMRWSFSEGTIVPPYGYIQYDVPGLTELIDCVPKYLSIKEFSYNLEKEFVKIVPGDRYVLSEQYAVYAPIAFGPQFRLPYTYTIEDIDFSFSALSIPSARLELQVESTIPLDFAAEAKILGYDSEIVEGIELNILDGAVLKAGTLENPVTSNLSIELTNTGSKGFSFDALELYLNASAPSEGGVHALNVNQGLHVKSIVIRVPDGISMDPNEEF